MPCQVFHMQYLLPEQTLISLKGTYRASKRDCKHITPRLLRVILKNILPQGCQLQPGFLHLNKNRKHFYINCGIWVIGHGGISSLWSVLGFLPLTVFKTDLQKQSRSSR